MAYSPRNKARDGSYRKIEIQLINPELKQQNLKLNYRAGYFSKTGAPEDPRNGRVRAINRRKSLLSTGIKPVILAAACVSARSFSDSEHPLRSVPPEVSFVKSPDYIQMNNSTSDRGRVLIVDDDRRVLELLVDLIELEGYAVASAAKMERRRRTGPFVWTRRRHQRRRNAAGWWSGAVPPSEK